MRTTTLLTLLLYFALPALAADADGNYAVKGAGIATCADFAKAKEASEREYFMYAGWAEGFISAANLYEDSTFDIVPWQNTDVLATALASYCRNVPTEKFHLAVSRMMQEFFPTRLRQRSPLLVLGTDTKGVVIYAEVLERTRQRLRETGHLDRGGEIGEESSDLDEATADALAAYQAEKDLPITRLPDQLTLLYLFTDVGGS